MMTSNSSEPVTPTADVTASASETGVKSESTTTTTQEKPSAFEALKETAKNFGETRPPGDPATPVAQKPAAPVVGVVPPGASPVPNAYQPNYKFKAFGKEHDLDEIFKPLIKDAESEKKVKDVFTKAYAFDDMKMKHESTANDFQALLTDHRALDQDVKKVMQFRNNKDFDNFFRSLRISDEEIYNWVQDKIERERLPPEQKRALDMQAQERLRNYDMEQENQRLQSQYQNQSVQARTMQLDMVLSRPDVSRTASAWDERAGQIGAFRGLVIEEAQRIYSSSGRDISAEEAAQSVMTRFGKFIEQPQAVIANQPTSQTPGMQASAPHAPQAKPVIPVITGQGTSPIKQAPKSLDDLRRMGKQMANAQNN